MTTHTSELVGRIASQEAAVERLCQKNMGAYKTRVAHLLLWHEDRNEQIWREVLEGQAEDVEIALEITLGEISMIPASERPTSTIAAMYVAAQIQSMCEIVGVDLVRLLARRSPGILDAAGALGREQLAAEGRAGVPRREIDSRVTEVDDD